MSDFASVYHTLPGPIDYETYFGMVMNSQRAADSQVYYRGLASTLANGRGDVPKSIVSAVCNSVEETEELEFDINANRAQAEVGM